MCGGMQGVPQTGGQMNYQQRPGVPQMSTPYTAPSMRPPNGPNALPPGWPTSGAVPGSPTNLPQMSMPYTAPSRLPPDRPYAPPPNPMRMGPGGQPPGHYGPALESDVMPNGPGPGLRSDVMPPAQQPADPYAEINAKRAQQGLAPWGGPGSQLNAGLRMPQSLSGLNFAAPESQQTSGPNGQPPWQSPANTYLASPTANFLGMANGAPSDPRMMFHQQSGQYQLVPGYNGYNGPAGSNPFAR
jgi:hypothetical protein